MYVTWYFSVQPKSPVLTLVLMKKNIQKLKNTIGRGNIWSALYNNVNTQHFIPVWIHGNGILERAGKNVGYVYAWVNGRGQHENSGCANPWTGQRRLTQDRFALFVFRLSAFEHDKSASARGFVWLPFDNASRINRKLLSLRYALPSIRQYTSRCKFKRAEIF